MGSWIPSSAPNSWRNFPRSVPQFAGYGQSFPPKKRPEPSHKTSPESPGLPYCTTVPVCAGCRSVFEELEAHFCPHCGAPYKRLPSRIQEGDAVDLGFGRAVLGDVLGEGGMGIVHRAWLYFNPAGPKAGQAPLQVAVKLLSPLLKGRERARRLFMSEAVALQRLSHPNIVEFLGLSMQSPQLALVMELVEGVALCDIIDQHVSQARAGGIPAMPMLQSWHYFSQLLGALAATHALGIVHRDVKPSNVLIRHDSVTKLTDFGIARLPAEEARQTGGIAPGTGAYMAPEQVLGEDPDPRTDLYSASIVLYEMLTGRTPFDRPDRSEIFVRTAQLEETAAPLTTLIPQAPPVLDVFFARALAKDRMHRFKSAIELGEQLRAALAIPDTPGWQAQRRLAASAQSISRGMNNMDSLASTLRADVSPEEANKLRTDVMTAYRG